MNLSLHDIARATGGKVCGRQVSAPGPHHSARDRSLSIRLSAQSPDGFIVFSHAGDPWDACRDHVADRLGLHRDRWRDRRELSPEEIERRRAARAREDRAAESKAAWLRRRVAEIWHEGVDPAGTIVERYLNSRGLDLPPEVAGSALRYHPSCPWEKGRTRAMIAAMRCVRTGALRALHRTALDETGTKLGRKMLAPAAGCAVMLDASEAVTTGLAVGEGVETVLAARQLGIRPAWALCSTGGISGFPILDGIEVLTVLQENDENGASECAVDGVSARWHQAGRTVDILKPRIGKDMNDALLAGRSA